MNVADLIWRAGRVQQDDSDADDYVIDASAGDDGVDVDDDGTHNGIEQWCW